jgi:hypothetical protein
MSPVSGMAGDAPAVASGRRTTATILCVVAVLLAVAALTLSYLGQAVLRPGPFADRAVAALRDPAVQADVADRLTAAVTSAGHGDLVAVRPLVRSLAGAIVESKAFAALFRRAVIEAHVAVVQHGSSRLLVTVADVGVLVQGVLERFSPAAARRIGAERASTLLALRPGGAAIDIVTVARDVYSLAWLLAVLAVLLGCGAILVSPDRRRAAFRLGIGSVLGGLGLVAVVTVGRAIADQIAPQGRGAAAGALWSAFLGGLRVQALLLAAAGALCAGLASGELWRAGREAKVAMDWLFVPRGARPPTIVGALGLIVLGAVLVLEPVATLTVAVQALGIYIVYRGVAGAVRAAAVAAPGVARAASSPTARVRQRIPVVVVAIALLGIVAIIVTGGGDEAPARTTLACDGSVALCNRPLNEVALPATHNSMASVTIPSWLFGQQDGTIADQLNYGIRGFLIDTYYGVAVRGGVQTTLESLPKLEAAKHEIGTAAVDAALRLRSKLGSEKGGRREIFLCHSFCELGAVGLDSALADLRSFLVANPDAVVVVINQDEGVAPADIERAVERAGLLDLVYRGSLGPFPTLRAMINSGQRLVVMAENDAGSVPWYRLAYEHALQETPFRFRSAAELTDPARLAASCRPNRGPASAPLFLLNHWVDTSPAPRPSLAAKVNAMGPLLARAQACERIRGRLPNLVAVDFYRRGGLLGVVNTLNQAAERR